jgi:hypothetical protein
MRGIGVRGVVDVSRIEPAQGQGRLFDPQAKDRRVLDALHADSRAEFQMAGEAKKVLGSGNDVAVSAIRTYWGLAHDIGKVATYTERRASQPVDGIYLSACAIY